MTRTQLQAAAGRTVLVGFADATSAPEVVWSLSDAGFQVVAFEREGVPSALRASRHARVLSVTDPGRALARTQCELEAIIRGLDQPILLPLDDVALFLGDRLDTPRELLCGATGRQASIALDKRIQLELARGAGFEVPNTAIIEGNEDLDRLSEFPAILKPALAARASGDHLAKGCFQWLADAADLDRFSHAGGVQEPLLAQRLIQGVGEGLFGLVDADGPRFWSAHQRVRMMNPAGSGSSACRVVDPRPDLIESAERFLRTAGWRGLFMIELLRGEDRVWFMEFNGRPWGSMAAARGEGFEYPAWAVAQHIDPTWSPPEPDRARSSGSRLYRHLGRELIHLAITARRPSAANTPSAQNLRQTVASVLRISKSDRWYNRRRDDPWVFWLDAWYTLRSRVAKTAGRGLLRRVRDRLRRPAVRREQRKLRGSAEIAQRVARAKRFLFVCYGNINRSALAEAHLSGRLPDGYEVSSCGFHARGRRPADPRMVTVADRMGIALAGWESRVIEERLIAEADVIFVMEVWHLIRLREQFPESSAKSSLLGCVAPLPMPLEIRDPFGLEASAYHRCAEEVTAATGSIAAAIARADSCRRKEGGAYTEPPTRPPGHLTNR